MLWLIDYVYEKMLAKGFATEAWVLAKGYATEAWVLAKTYATEAFVRHQDNTVLAWVAAQNYLTTSFVDRGDPDDYDWTKADLVTDWTWRDLDLSSVVPAGAKAVALTLRIKATSVHAQVLLRTKGNIWSRNVSQLITQAADVAYFVDVVVHPDTNRKIQYRIANVTWTYIYVVVKGWWL